MKDMLSFLSGYRKEKAWQKIGRETTEIYGHNQDLMEKCRKLGEYSTFVNILREFTAGSTNKKEAFSEAEEKTERYWK